MALLLLCFLGLTSPAGGGNRAHPVDTVTAARLREAVRADSGNVVLVNVWATWCKWCKEEMPGLLDLRKRLAPAGFRLILVSADDEGSAADLGPALDALGVDFPTYMIRDTSDDAFITAMNPKWSGALPASFIYDRSGAMVEMVIGERTAEELSVKVGKYLK